MKHLTFLFASAILCSTRLLPAQVPQIINYQGRIAVGGTNFNGSGQFKFALVNSNASISFWSNDGTGSSGSEPTAPVTIPVSYGLYSVLIGDSSLSNMVPISSSVFTNNDVRLRVWFNDGVNGFQLLAPDQRIAAVGYAMIAGNANTATVATSFTGGLSGDVTGTQGATVVASVGGQTAANLASGASLANAATTASTPGTIVKRDGSGSFTAGAITASSLAGNGSGLTSLNAGNVSSGTLADARLSGNVPLLNGNNAFIGSNNLAGVLVATNTNNVLKGTLSGKVTGNVTGDVTGNLVGAASTATNFSAALNGDVTGTQGAKVVASVGGQTAANVAGGASGANAATSANIASTIVKRDASGNFAAGIVSANLAGNATTATTANNFSGSLSGDVAGTQSATVVANVGGQSAANVASGASAGNAATSLNTANTIVKRDGSGNFSAGTVIGSFSGNGAGMTNLNGVSLVNGSVGAAQIAAGAVGNTQLAANAVQTGNILAGAVGSNQLASGAAVANLQASGQSGVASGGVILSANPTAPNLVNSGWVRVGKTVIGLDAWDQRASSSPLAGRSYFSAVWTGTEMIVWGGYDGTNALASGGRYNPAMNTWTPLPTNGAPTPRLAHAAVWTGNEMVVWGGGNSSSTYFNDGCRYNPVSDGWVSTTSTAAPTPRLLHSSVWTGNEMIVFGGLDTSSSYFNSTASYSLPATLYLYLKP